MSRPNTQATFTYIYFVGETDVFRYETSEGFVDSVRREYPDLALETSRLPPVGIGTMLGDSLDHDKLELRLKTQPENRVYAGMVLLAESFLAGSESFRALRKTGFNSIMYSVFRLAEGGYLIRACGSFKGAGLLPSEEAIAKLTNFISMPFLRSRFESDGLSPDSIYRLIAKQLDKTGG